jgi:hypothetical protein
LLPAQARKEVQAEHREDDVRQPRRQRRGQQIDVAQMLEQLADGPVGDRDAKFTPTPAIAPRLAVQGGAGVPASAKSMASFRNGWSSIRALAGSLAAKCVGGLRTRPLNNR